jgi:O-antigen/teichoic acid export membrane protein
VVTSSLLVAASAVLAAAVISAVITFRLVRSDSGFDKNFSLPKTLNFLRCAGPFMGAALAIQTIANADAFLINLIVGKRDLGLYAAPYAIAGYSLVIGGALMSAAYPRIARVEAEGAPNPLVGQLGAIMGTVALPIAVGGICIAGPLLTGIFGESYAQSSGILAVLMAVPLVGYLNMTVGQTLTAVGFQNAVFRTAAVVAVVNVILNMVAIHYVGIFGAAIVAALTELLTLLLYIPLAAQKGIAVPFRDFFAAAPAALVMGIALYAGQEMGISNVWVLISVGLASYTVGLSICPTRGVRLVLSFRKSGPV